MNANKKYNGWILCPSQSLPGKFYYFNVLSGEAAWSLNEAEKKDIKQDSAIHKIAEKSHCYPEPDSPPIDESPNTSSSIYRNYKKPDVNNVGSKYMPKIVAHSPTPVFGQAVFPKYVSNMDPYIPNIIWTPIQIPTSMFITSEVKKPTLDQVTQTVELYKDVFVQSCAVPLCKRFINYEKPILNFNKDNKIQNRNDLPKLYSSTPTKCSRHMVYPRDSNYLFGQIKSDHVNNDIHRRPLIKEPVLKNVSYSENQQKLEYMNSSKSLSELFTKQLKNFKNSEMVIHGKNQGKSIDLNINQFKNNLQIGDNYFTHGLNKINRHPETITGFSKTQTDESDKFQKMPNTINWPNTLDQDFKNLNVKSLNSNLGLNVKHAADIKREKTASIKENDIELDRDDLRLLLVARKRKLSDTDTRKSGFSEDKKLKPIYTDETRPVTLKKMVTFNIDNQSGEHEEQTEETFGSSSKVSSSQPAKSPIFQTLRDLAKFPVRKDCWYIVADTNVLLDDFEFIENLVQSDDSCRLLIPHAVHTDIVALTSGDSRGRQRVYVARQIARRLPLPSRHIVVQPAVRGDVTDMCTIDCILNCSLEAMHQKYHVVLITDDFKLQTKAQSLHLHCYRMQEVRQLTSILTPEVTFDLKKFQITVKNNTNAAKNNLFLQNDFNPYIFDNKDEIPVNSVKQRLFDDVPKGKSDKLIDITKPKHPNNITQPIAACTINYDSETTGMSTEISRDIQRLNLRGNNVVKPNTETRHSNKNLTRAVNDFQKWNNEKELVNLKKEFQNINAFDKRMSNSNDNQMFHYKDASEQGIDVTQLKNQNDLSNSVVTSLLVQNGLKQTAFDHEKLLHTNFHRAIPNSNNVINQPATNTGTTKLNDSNELSMDNKLKRFNVKHREIEERIITRIDEWTCCFTQIMEETLSNVIQENQLSDLPPPWTLHEAMRCIRTAYSDNQNVCMIIDTYDELTSDHICGKGYLNSSIKPNDFLKIIGCSTLLMETLKTVIPNHQELTEAEHYLNNIIRLVENPSLDPNIPQSAPVLSRFDKSLEGEARQNFVKEPSDIIKYLKKHYIQWTSYNDVTDDNNYIKKYMQYQSKGNGNANIVRTFGKSLGLLKIDKCKIMTMGTQADGTKIPDEPKTKRLFENDRPVISNKTEDGKSDMPAMNTKEYPSTGPGVIGVVESSKDLETKKTSLNLTKHGSMFDRDVTKTEPKVMMKLDNINKFNLRQTKEKSTSFVEDLNFSNHENTFIDREVTYAPIIVRNIKIIDALEEKLKNKPGDLDDLDYSDIDDDMDQSEADQLDSEVMENIISDHDPSDNTESNAKVNQTANDSGFNNTNYSDNNNADSIGNNHHGDNNDDPRDNNARYCINNDNRNRDAMFINDQHFGQRDDSRGILDLKCQNNDKFPTTDNDQVNDDQVNDSGIESESAHAYPLAKSFLTELSSSLKVIHHFIETSVRNIRSEDFGDEKKKQLYNKAKKTHQCVDDIVYNLKSIIAREASGGAALKDLLIKAGVHVSSDKRMSKYRQIVRKCLEQTQILQNALKTMLAMTDTDFETTTSIATESISSSIRFLNIFE